MRICVLTQTFPRFKGDPTAPFMKSICDGLVAAGNQVYVLAPYSPKYKKTHEKYKVITYKYALIKSLHTLGYSQTLINDRRFKLRVGFLAPLLFIFGIIALYKLVKKEKIEIVSAHWILPNGFIAAIIKIITGVKVFSTLPGSDVYVAKKSIIFRTMALFASNISDGITSNSNQLKEDLLALGAKIKKFRLIAYSVDSDFFNSDLTMNSILRKKYSISKSTKIVLAVGRLVEKKGFQYLIESIPIILNKYHDVKFIIVGDGDLKEKLQNEINKLKISDNCIIIGAINYKMLKNYYNLCDIFILPSVRDSEGNLDDQSVAVVEAMSCGKPVITTNFPGYQHVIASGKNGILIPEKNSKKISEEIIFLLSNKLKRKEIGKAARKTIVNNFSSLAIGKQYTDFFNTL